MSPAERASRSAAAALLSVHGEPVDAVTAAGTFTGLKVAITDEPMSALPDEQHRDKRQRATVYIDARSPGLEIGDVLIDGNGARWIITGLVHDSIRGLVAYSAVADGRLGPDT